MGARPVGEIKRLVYEQMAAAYAAASDGGRLPAPARNVAYSLRELTGLGDELQLDYCLKRKGNGLIQRYIDEHPEETAEWDVLRDARGLLNEPHTGRSVPLGTKDVREYLGRRSHRASDREDLFAPSVSVGWGTSGPEFRFGAVLYIEKEGFGELLNAAEIGERFDLAVMSSKGYSVRAARRLLTSWARQFPDLKVLVAHDFDKQGIGIYDLIRSEVPNAIDVGLRLADVEDPRWGLAGKGERVTYRSDPVRNLVQRGASKEEIAFLRRTPREGRRVELNALSGGRRVVEFVEAKLEAAGVAKVIPDEETLEAAFRRMYLRMHLNEAIEEALPEAQEAAAGTEVPEGLAEQIEERFGEKPQRDWEDALSLIVSEHRSDEEDDDDDL